MSLKWDYINVSILALCEAIFMTTALVNVAIGGLAAQSMLNDNSFATLPQAVIPIVSMLVTIPASIAMKRIGRRVGFIIGAGAGMLSTALCAWALQLSSFGLFLTSVAIMGVYQAFATYYRFAVADQAEEAFKGKAVSLVLAGGVLAAFAGPTLATGMREMFSPVMFVGSYMVAFALNLVAVILLALLRLPARKTDTGQKLHLSLKPILHDKRVLTAMVFCGFGSALMMLVMTATPLAMAGCGFSLTTTGLVISWHVAAMFELDPIRGTTGAWI